MRPPPPLVARPTTPAAPLPTPLPFATAPPSTPTRSTAGTAHRDGAPAPDFHGAGVGWRSGASKPRSADAEALFQAALVELQQRNHQKALKLLRSALTLAPGDREIAEAIARAMGIAG
jgi:tetratricopeptide (TPR) repeat protein